jgi:uncharacterized protein YndB with AHSA1/START domain
MPESKSITKSITIFAPAKKVWDALTIPELMKVWMFDSEINIESEFKVGMPIKICGTLHEQAFENIGTIQIFEPAKKFQYTSLSSLSHLKNIPENYSVLTFELSENNNQTAITFTQTNFPGKASYEHSNFYWGTALVMLKKFIEGSTV